MVGRVLSAWISGLAVVACLLVGAAGLDSASAETKHEPAAAASPAAPPEALDQRVEEEARVIEADIGQTLIELRQSLRAAVASASGVPGEIGAALARDTAEEGRGWLLEAVLSGLAAIVVGLVVAIAFERMTMARLPRPAPEAGREARSASLLVRTLLRIVGTAILVVVGFVVIEVVDTGVDVRHRTALILLVVFACARGALLISREALAPEMPPGVATPAETARLRGWVTTFLVVYAIVAAIDWWLLALGLSDEARDLTGIAVSLLLVVFLSALCMANRRSVPAALGHRDHDERGLGSLFGRFWWVIAIAYFVVAWVARGVHVLLDEPGSDGLVTAPVVLLFVGLILYGVLSLLVERLVPPGPVLWIGGPGGVRLRDNRDLAHDGVGLIVLLIAFGALAHVWGAALVGSSAGATLVKVAAICVVGWIVYDMVRIAIDRKHAHEGGIPNIVAEDEEFAPLPLGKSRLATLLPLARIFVLSAIVVIIVMMVLSELGVNVIPLFAGASIFGLAIGFGSQTLVRDVMSGAFFLVDDAFRVGEYVDLGGGSKGTVEKISIRSFQLRHQNGPLHTIPFGDIKQITNLSRDWAITKLPFTFPHGTDVEKVRKVIKKAGEALAADPVLGPHFLQPLKSQGVVEMDSNAMTFAVKFMTPPADASLVRRAVYARLSQAFIDAGLSFASSSVTVRIANDGAAPLTEEQKRMAAAGAAQTLQAPAS
jgi:small-conductance mechanosensitive channel